MREVGLPLSRLLRVRRLLRARVALLSEKPAYILVEQLVTQKVLGTLRREVAVLDERNHILSS